MNRTTLILAAALLLPFSARSADLTLKVIDKKPPEQIAEAIRNLLQAKAVQLLDGDKAVYEFWFVNEIALKSKPAAANRAVAAIGETTLIGAAAVSNETRDHKDNSFPTGFYTMRFVMQPQDGDHLGTADFPYFVALIAADRDQTPDAISRYKQMVNVSGNATASGHPVVLSLRPLAPDEGAFPRLDQPTEELKAMCVKVPASADGEKTSVAFGLVYQGHGHIQ